jgi:hypothetical protein
MSCPSTIPNFFSPAALGRDIADVEEHHSRCRRSCFYSEDETANSWRNSGLLPDTCGARERRKPPARWLCWGATANASPLAKFPDNRENTGNFGLIPSPAVLNPLKPAAPLTNSLHMEQGIFYREQGKALR